MEPARGFALACTAALAASAGDLALLLVSTGPHFRLDLPAPRLALAVGAGLGVAGIPLYALGYAAAARRVCAGAPLAARTVRLAGAAASALGAGVHAVTAALIWQQLSLEPSASAPQDPLSAVAASPPLVGLWAAAGACFLAANAALVWRAAWGPEKWALASPLAWLLALAALGSGFEAGRWLLVPAAPNLAHAVFFALGRAKLSRA